MGTKAKHALLLLALLVIVRGPVFSQTADPRVIVGGQQVLFQDYKIKDGSFFVAAADHALPEMIQYLGGRFSFDEDQNQITIGCSGHLAYVFPSGLSIDGNNVPVKVPSLIQNGKWYVSLDTLAQAMGTALTSDQDQNSWYVDPYVTGASIQVTPSGVSFNVQSSGPVEPSVTVIDNPGRIVADFPYSVLAEGVVPPQDQSNPISSNVQVSQLQTNPNVVRLVITLANSDVHWDTIRTPDGRSFTLAVAPNIPFKNWAAEEAAAEKAKEQAAASNVASAPPAGPATTLDGFGIGTQGEGDRQLFVVNLNLSGATAYEWHQLKGPDNRLFIDLKNCTQHAGQIPANSSPLIDGIRVAQFQKVPYPVARVVFSLRDSYVVDLKPVPKGLQVIVSTQVQNLTANLSGAGTTGNPVPPTPTTAADTTSKPVHARLHPNGITIVLDPGHGGGDTGAIGRHLMEKNVTIDIARKLRKLLTQDGFTVLMTRETDRECLGYEGTSQAELQCRADVANRAHAALFISLHINGNDASWPNGIATYWYKAMDVSLANTLQKHLGAESGFQNRGILHAGFWVLRHTHMPSVLVEMGFITNPNDEARLQIESTREKLAEILQQGISEYAGLKQTDKLQD